MTEITIPVEGRFDTISSTLKFSRLVEESFSKRADAFKFDFSKIGFVCPTTLVALYGLIKSFKQEKENAGIQVNLVGLDETNDKHTYMGHMGLFLGLGVDFGKAPNEAAGSSRYLPITNIERSEIDEQAEKKYQEAGDVIEEKTEALTSVLLQTGIGDAYSGIQFSFREMLRNVFEHSGAGSATICAQYWPSKHKAEVCIFDLGMGLKRSLLRNPRNSCSSDREAITIALMPGVSGNVDAGKGGHGDVWQNSGFGLYMVSRICGTKGKFALASGHTAVGLQNARQLEKTCFIPGTLVSMTFRTNELEGLSGQMKEIRSQAIKLAAENKTATSVEPSVASVTLARDFKKE
ncbi:hypothetical protein [Kordiimonas aestuarii]|uniref:hypothetical protein n=1 Tax=Kordiimonas aestuarii TaxID=1005925 RepID=UPI0021D0707E|nr:hypothetical protein [Kordiimonas aestuarii]